MIKRKRAVKKAEIHASKISGNIAEEAEIHTSKTSGNDAVKAEIYAPNLSGKISLLSTIDLSLISFSKLRYSFCPYATNSLVLFTLISISPWVFKAKEG